MTEAVWTLLAIGVLGGIDVVLFHSLAHGLRKHAPSRHELWTHACRGPTYALLFVLLPNVRVAGSWVWLPAAVLVLDLLVSIWDFSVERKSRELLGGLPTGEYLLHVLIAVLYGALLVFAAQHLVPLAGEPDAITWEPYELPLLARGACWFFAAASFGTGVLDLLAARRLGTR